MTRTSVRHVALLRGINVGKAKRVTMQRLREALASLGYANVETALNSGNAVFDAANESTEAHARRIRRTVDAQLQVDCHVVVKTAAEFARIVAANPLSDASDPSRLLVVCTQHTSQLEPLADLDKIDWQPERIALGKHAGYLWCPGGILASPLAKAVGRALGDATTTRNWTTVLRVYALLEPNAQR
jgi:uncharacterized protein (DUF1697 family)